MKISILEKVVAGAVLIRGHATDNSLTRTLYRCRLRFHAVFPESLLTKGAGIFPYSWSYHLLRLVNGHRLTRSLQNMMHPPHPPPCTENYLCGRYDFTVQVVQRQPATPERGRSQLKTAMARPMGTILITDAGEAPTKAEVGGFRFVGDQPAGDTSPVACRSLHPAHRYSWSEC